jgi:hypothetical protein
MVPHCRVRDVMMMLRGGVADGPLMSVTVSDALSCISVLQKPFLSLI